MQNQNKWVLSETWLLGLLALILLCVVPTPRGMGGSIALLFVLLLAAIGLGIKHLFVKRFPGGAPHRWGSLLLSGACEALLFLLITDLWNTYGDFKSRLGFFMGCLTLVLLVGIATAYPHWRFISGELERADMPVEMPRTLAYALVMSLTTPVLFVAVVSASWHIKPA